MVLADGPRLELDDFPPELRGPAPATIGAASIPGAPGQGLDDQVAALEQRLIRDALAAHGGNSGGYGMGFVDPDADGDGVCDNYQSGTSTGPRRGSGR